MNIQKNISQIFIAIALLIPVCMSAQFSNTTVQDAAQVAQPSSALVSIDEVDTRSQSAPVKKEKKKAVVPVKTPIIEQHNEEVLPDDAYLVDKIEAVVFAPEGTKVITQSELARPGLDGRNRTLDDLILERLLLLDALKFKMIPDDETIDKYLANIQRENNLTLDGLKKIFKSAGYSYEEGREQFGMMSIVNQLLDFKIRSRLIVPEKEVIAYYNENPEAIEATYFIERAIVPYIFGKTHEQQQEEIELFIKHGIGLLSIDWQAPYWMAHSEFAHDKMFIVDLQPGSISAPQATMDGFELFRVKDSKPAHNRPLEDRYREIVEVLRKPKYEQLMDEYKKQLFDTASILDLR